MVPPNKQAPNHSSEAAKLTKEETKPSSSDSEKARGPLSDLLEKIGRPRQPLRGPFGPVDFGGVQYTLSGLRNLNDLASRGLYSDMEIDVYRALQDLKSSLASNRHQLQRSREFQLQVSEIEPKPKPCGDLDVDAQHLHFVESQGFKRMESSASKSVENHLNLQEFIEAAISLIEKFLSGRYLVLSEVTDA